MAKRGLGKGLGALIQGLGDLRTPNVQEIPTSEIELGEQQPRKSINEETLEELASSIKEHGILQPVVVRRKGIKYELIAGERRYRAAALAGISSLPAIIKNVDNEECLMLTLIENLQREDLNPLEEAEGYQALVTKYGLTQEQVSMKLGKKRTTITNSLRLLKLPKEVKAMLESGEISAGHARAVLSLSEKEKQIELARKINQRGLSVREAEKLSLKMKKPHKVKPARDIPASVIRSAKKLEKSLERRVKVGHSGSQAKLEIIFESPEEIEAFVEKFLRQEK